MDFSSFQRANVEAEERRLMPHYVEKYFLNASREVGLKVEPRADGLWRIEHLLADLRFGGQGDMAVALNPQGGKMGSPSGLVRKTAILAFQPSDLCLG